MSGRLRALADGWSAFVIIAVLVLAVVWGATAALIALERDAARASASASVAELTGTYEAQVARVVREIGQALRLVRHELAEHDAPVLPPLDASGLLPPTLLYTVAYAGADGRVREATGPLPRDDVSGADFFEAQRHRDAPAVGMPWLNPATNTFLLPFSTRLPTRDGGFGGAVFVLVDAAYFVSSYDPARFGHAGVLGLLGADGAFRIRRTGDAEHFGDRVDYGALLRGAADDAPRVVLEASAWDGVRRYIGAQPVYGFPLAIVVGLAEAERLDGAAAATRVHIWRAVGASTLALAVLFALGRMNRAVQRAKARALDEQVAHAARVEHLAFHDSLTGLPNRAYFTRFLADTISQTRRYGRELAVLLLDLDRFKVVNDTLGHAAGDDLLKIVSARLRTVLRDSDFVARLGGDEFVILLPERKSERELSEVAARVLTVIGEPCRLAGREVRPTASVGICVYPGDGQDEQTLLKHADLAMYHAKAEGKNNYQFYSERLSANSVDRLALESGMARALERDEFVLYYQARVEAASGRVVGAEALLRWNRPGVGLVPPMSFIPLAEETGQIVAIGRWVLRAACRQGVAWHRAGLTDMHVSVNLSARQFADDGLLDDLRAALVETGMDPGLLEFEITESMLMRDILQAKRVLAELRSLGIRIAVDDFGTGYSSLSTLKQFPIDVIKIDGSFVRGALEDPQDRGLTEAVIAVGKALNLIVVAEGVETAEHAEFLGGRGCNELQGYLINRPQPADAFASLLAGGAVDVRRA